MNEEPTTFGEALDGLMRARGWNQHYVAVRLGVYDADVSRWRRGKGGISIQNVRKVAQLFETDPAPLERLAGYGDNNIGGDKDSQTIDPGMAAMLDSETAAMRQRLSSGGYPKATWGAIISAWRAMADLADATLGDEKPRDAVSQLSDTQLANAEHQSPNSQRRGEDGPPGKLPVRYREEPPVSRLPTLRRMGFRGAVGLPV